LTQFSSLDGHCLLLSEFVALLSRWAKWCGCGGWCSYSRSLVGHRHAFSDDTEACQWNLLWV